jgi:hypothetical protein
MSEQGPIGWRAWQADFIEQFSRRNSPAARLRKTLKPTTPLLPAERSRSKEWAVRPFGHLGRRSLPEIALYLEFFEIARNEAAALDLSIIAAASKPQSESADEADSPGGSARCFIPSRSSGSSDSPEASPPSYQTGRVT